MHQKNKLILILELLWLAIIAVLIFAFVMPLQDFVSQRFLLINSLLIFLFVQYARLLVALRISFLSELYYPKIILFFSLFILFFVVMKQFSIYIGPLKDQTLFPFNLNIPYGTYERIFREWLFFGTGCLILTPLLILRLYLSIIKQKLLRGLRK